MSDAYDGTRWVVKVILPDGRHVRPYVGPGVSFKDARRLAKGMLHQAYAAKVWEPPEDAWQWPAHARPEWLRLLDEVARKRAEHEAVMDEQWEQAA